MLMLNILLAIAWAAVSGELSIANLLVGLAIGYAVLWVASRPMGKTRYFAKVGRVGGFVLFFFWELLVATLRVAVDIVTPRHLMKPAVLAIPTEAKSAGEVTALANALTLTPGTLALDISPDGKTLYLHAMYAEDVEGVRRDVQQGMGQRIRQVFE